MSFAPAQANQVKLPNACDPDLAGATRFCLRKYLEPRWQRKDNEYPRRAADRLRKER